MRFLILALFALSQISAQAQTFGGRFIAHEWGTFTAVQGSDGVPLGGMSHEEETLPSFIMSRDVFTQAIDPRCHKMKGMPVCDDDFSDFITPIYSADVTQKMETPVIYFHSDRPRQVHVDVGFPGGIISQYYPAPTTFSPAIGRITGLQNGRVGFDVSVVTNPLPIPEVKADSVYRPARDVDANYISSQGQNEKFIFYRGLGNFTTNLSVISIDGNLAVRNSGNEAIPAAYLLDATPGSHFVLELGEIAANSTRIVPQDAIAAQRAQGLTTPSFLLNAANVLNKGLERSGLYRDESVAMTNTWKNSYFRNPGLRVLYILARPETERLLPLTMTPKPQELVRTLVGRIEVMTDVEERSLLNSLRAGNLQLTSLGRFAEPKLRRLLQLTKVSTEQARIQELIKQVN